MIAATLNDDKTFYSVLMVVIEKTNLDRMKLADPITLESIGRGGLILDKIRYPLNFSILIAYEEDDAELYRLAREGNAGEILKWLERGRTWDPKTDGQANMASL
jgi:hypothetical protein